MMQTTEDTLLNYSLTTQPEVVEVAEVVTLTIAFNPRDNDPVWLKAFEMNVPIGTSAYDLVDDSKKIKYQLANLPEGLTSTMAGGKLTIKPQVGEPVQIPANNTIRLTMQVNTNSVSGNCTLKLTEQAQKEKESKPVIGTQEFTLVKFPTGFSITQFKAEKTVAYSGEELNLSWQAKGLQEHKITVYLQGPDGQSIDVTTVSSYKEILSSTKEIDVKFNLRATYLDKSGSPAALDIPLPYPIHLYPAKVEIFSVTPLIAYVGDKVTLSWQKYGAIDHYVLDLGGEDKKILPGDTLQYSVNPTCTTSYYLYPYADASGSTQLDAKVGKVTVWQYQFDKITASDFSFLAMAPDYTKLYALDVGAKSLSVIKTADNTVVATIPMDNVPATLAVTPDGTKVYLANPHDNKVSVIKAVDNTVMATIPVDNAVSLAVTPDGTKVYVTQIDDQPQIDDNVSVINTANNTVMATISVGHAPIHLAVTPDSTKVYVANSDDGSVSVIKTADNTVMATIPVGRCRELAITPDGTKVYVAIDDMNQVSVIKTADDTVVATIPVGKRPMALVVTPDGAMVYVANQDDHSVSAISTVDNTVKAIIPVDGYATLAITPDGTKLCVKTVDKVSVIKTADNTVMATILAESDPYYGLAPMSHGVFSGFKAYVGGHNGLGILYSKEAKNANSLTSLERRTQRQLHAFAEQRSRHTLFKSLTHSQDKQEPNEEMPQVEQDSTDVRLNFGT